MSIEEKVVYRSTGTSDNWTVAERMAWIDSSYGYGISRAVQAFGYDRFRKNVAKATRGFQFVLDSMYGSKLVSSPSLLLTCPRSPARRSDSLISSVLISTLLHQNTIR